MFENKEAQSLPIKEQSVIGRLGHIAPPASVAKVGII
jgi:hypothetical protein